LRPQACLHRQVLPPPGPLTARALRTCLQLCSQRTQVTMAVMLRFLGQASKQTTQHLAPPALTPKRLAMGGATPRTPKTPAPDSSPFFAGQRSPPAFFHGEQDIAAPPQNVAINVIKPGPFGFAASPQVGFGIEVPCGSPRTVVAEADHDPFFLKDGVSPAAASDQTTDSKHSAEDTPPAGRAAAAPGRELPVLLGRRRPPSAKLIDEPKFKLRAPEASHAHEAFLARQMRIASRRPPPEGELSVREAEVELAKSTREAFLSRQAAIAGRRLLART